MSLFSHKTWQRKTNTQARTGIIAATTCGNGNGSGGVIAQFMNARKITPCDIIAMNMNEFTKM